MKFSHLHNHTQFSLLDGASSIGRLYDKAAKDRMPAMAITDHGNMFGVFEFVSQAWKNTKVVGKREDGKDIVEPVVKPVIGCEFYLVEDRTKRQFSRDEKDARYHQLLLAKDETGYRNLAKLCSLGYMEGLYGKYPRIDRELVEKYHEGLIATTCCLGAQVPRTILKKGEEEAEKVFQWWHNLFGDDYYVEVQRHDIPEQIKVNEVLLKFARKYNVPVIASNDSHYVDREDANAHDILLCINTGEKQSTPTNKDFADDDEQRPKDTRFAFYNDQFYFKNTDEMSKLFADLPEAIDNTNLIVDKIKPMKLEREILLPHFKVPENFKDDQDGYLEYITWEGAKERYKELTPEIEDRIKFELFTIRTMGFAGYFLIVSDFIKAGRDLGVFVGPGRGSAAGSAVAYCIGITNIDPIKYNLLFERFLNPERKSMPDIDTDFDDVGRQKVIDYVVDKYGKNQVAHIVTYGTMAAKMSIKDVARALDLPLPDSNALAKLVPERPGIALKRVLHAPVKGDGSLEQKEGLGAEELEGVNKLREIYNDEKLLQSKVLHEAEKLEGSVRNTGIHAAGIIIAPKDLTELIPVATTKDVDLLITQYEGGIIENAGVIKMDFLGLKTLTILKDALALIKRNYGLEIDLDTIPLDDAATYELYQRGETNGTFQFESPGMQKYLRELKPDKFDDLIAMNALYRPGPLEYIPNFIKRKHGEEAIVYDVDDMKEYLEETYGITVYQEQVMLLSQKLAGFSKGDADVLRKAMGKKQKAVLDKMKGQFVEGAKAKGHPEDKLNKIWTDWEAFAQYAFNKSHSTCYAFVAYQTAYLKAHYPAEFMAAVLNNQGNIDKIKFYMEECQRMGLQVLGPDVNESLKGFAVSGERVIRFGMNAIKGVGEAAVEDVIAEREKNGKYATVYDFIARINQRTVNKKSLESLVLAGALDCFTDMHRAQYFYMPPTDPISGLERLVRFGNQVQASTSMATSSLFGDAAMPDVKPPQMPLCEPWALPELLDREKEVVGIYLSAHPLDGYKFEMEHYGFTPISDIEKLRGRTIRIAGYVTDAAHMTTKKGSKFGKLVLNDYSGHQEIVFWENNYVQYSNYIDNGQKLLITGMYQEHKYRPGVMEFQIQGISLLDQVRKSMTRRVNLHIPLGKIDDVLAQFIYDNVKQHPGHTELTITVWDEEADTTVKLRTNGMKVELNDSLIQFMTGTETVEYKVEVG
ncbi:DNA polymerase III subunit alpha [Chitinophagaceae bacterium IBVUCB1]|nr:DNA polymerase III subunit alpha [Chitinophagaceae bacterium IBVUCB1]